MPDGSPAPSLEPPQQIEAPAVVQPDERSGEKFSQWWPVRDVLIPFALTRITLVIVGWFALQALHSLPATAGAWEIKGHGDVGRVGAHISPYDYPLVNMWSRWDAGWYHSIAEHGYNFAAGKQSNTAFFPVYPALIRVLHQLWPSNSDVSWMVSGIFAANLSLLAGLIYLVRLVRLDYGPAVARRAALYALVFPTTLFFSAVYTEATFLATTVAAFYHARRGQWVAAGVFGGAAVLTRSPGILICLPLAIEYLAQRDFKLRRIRLDAVTLLIPPMCLGALLLYFQWRFGNALAIRDAQIAWGGGWGLLSWPWEPYLALFERKIAPKDIVDLIFALALLALAVLAWRKLKPSYGWYALASYWFVTAWGTLESVPRYALGAFPIFIVLALYGRDRVFHHGYVVAGMAFATLFMMLFSLWRWVA